jgi:SAM-dependent methyltransferase
MIWHLLGPFGRAYTRRFLKNTFSNQSFRRTNERPVEYAFAFSWLNRAQPRTVLDVGSGRSALPSMLRSCGFIVTAIDSVTNYWSTPLFNHHWHIVEDDILASRLPAGTFDAITCISVFEHIADPVGAVAGMHRLLRPGGTLILTTPFGTESHANVYTLPGSYGASNAYPCRQSSPADLESWLAAGFRLVDQEYWRLFSDSAFWSCGPLLRPPERSPVPAHLGCFAMQKAGGDGPPSGSGGRPYPS